MDYTSRAQLRKPPDGEPQDVADLNFNADRIDAFGMGAYICTSTTRPTGVDRWDGLMIKETDTKAYGFWDAAATKWMMFDTVWQTTPLILSFGDATHPVIWNSATQLQKYFRTGNKVDVSVTAAGHASMVINGGAGFGYFKYPLGAVPNDGDAGNGYLGRGFIKPTGAGALTGVNVRKTVSVATREYYVLSSDTDVGYDNTIWGSNMILRYRYSYDME